jgi:chemotaxis protein MotB
MEESPEMQEFQENIQVDMTDEGMRIQIVDQEGGSMFKSGSAEMAASTRRVLSQIAKVVQRLPNSIPSAGHTDASPFDRRGYTNWELSTDRANASRRALIGAGIELDRVVKVIGNADMDPLSPEDPFAAHNRRISIVLLREVPVLPPELQKKR